MGDFKHFDAQFELLCQRLKDAGKIHEISTTFAQCQTDRDRIGYLLGLGAIENGLHLPESVIGKSNALAAEHRTSGNGAFQKKRYIEALQHYTRSVASAAPPEASDIGNDLSLAFANRSATLFYLNQWKECLLDIDYALKHSYPVKLHYKLYLRKGQCHAKLEQSEKAKSAFLQSRDLLASAELDSKKKAVVLKDISNHMEKLSEITNDSSDKSTQLAINHGQPQIASKNSIFTSLSDACDVTYSPNQGRFIYATRDIKPGELILVEKAYTSVLLDHHVFRFCAGCYRYCLPLLPCPGCPSALYCSEDCQKTSWENYHQYECGLLSNLYLSGVGKFGHLALRTVLQSGLDHLISYKHDLESGKYKHETPLESGFNEDGLYLHNEFHAIHSLVTHDTDRTVHDLFRRAVMAIYILKLLQKSSFFDRVDPSVGVFSFIGGLLLSHLQSYPCNAHEISHLELSRSDVASSVPVELGAGIYSSLSLFNHSCDPGVNRNFYGDVCVVRAIKTIHKGEEIADNYGAVYAVHSKEERLEKLRPQYYFECQCQACVNNWPLYQDIPNVNPRWKCQACFSKLSSTKKIGLYHCAECNLKYNVEQKEAQLNKSREGFGEGFMSLMACDVDSSLPKLLSHLSTIDQLMMLPWREYNDCQETIKQCYSIMGNCHVVGKS